MDRNQLVEDQCEVIAGLQKAMKVLTDLAAKEPAGIIDRSAKDLGIAFGIAVDKLAVLEGFTDPPEGFKRVITYTDFSVALAEGLPVLEEDESLEQFVDELVKGASAHLRRTMKTAVARVALSNG
jgi:hypothetical protein